MQTQILKIITLILAGATLVVFHASALTLTGKVTSSDDQALAGVQITLTRADGLFAETAYSNESGRFVLRSAQQGKAEIRTRKLRFADARQEIDLENTSSQHLSFKLHKLSTAKELSDNLTASAHFSRIKFDSPRDLHFFKLDCLTCHQLGNPHTRRPLSREAWEFTVARMLGFWGINNKKLTNDYTDALYTAFDNKLVDIRQQESIEPLIFDAHIYQWKLPEGDIAHDVEYYPADGRFYTVDMGNDQIYITDPLTNQSEIYQIPTGGIPVGGKFKTLYNLPPPGGIQVSRGPHSLQVGPDGKFYTTDTISGQIGVFDPKTRTYEGYDIGGNAMYPHTLRFDKQGHVWFTLSISNQVGRFDPVSKKMTVIDLPPTSDRPELPILNPYGIDIHPLDGSVWYSRLQANRIGRIDASTLEVEEFTLDFVGPRRLRFARDGTLWIPAYGDGTLEKLDTRTMTFTSYLIPPLSKNEREAPYALGVHPETQEVWITANMSDRMFRFLPAEERFIAYPLPTRGIFLRDIIFTPDGRVCSANNTATPRINLEGGMEEVICVDPDYYSDS